MKLLPVTHSIVHRNAGSYAGTQCSRANAANLLRPTFIRPLRARPRSGDLVAHWHVSRQNGRLECRWLLDGQSADDQLWTSPHITKRRCHCRARSSPRRHLIARVTDMSSNLCHSDLTASASRQCQRESLPP